MEKKHHTAKQRKGNQIREGADVLRLFPITGTHSSTRGPCCDTDGIACSPWAWLGAATLCTAMQRHSDNYCPSPTGDPGLFWCNSSLLSTSDCIEGDDIILENSCRLEAASGSNDCVFILAYFFSENTLRCIFFCSYVLHHTPYCRGIHYSLKPNRARRSEKGPWRVACARGCDTNKGWCYTTSWGWDCAGQAMTNLLHSETHNRSKRNQQRPTSDLTQPNSDQNSAQPEKRGRQIFCF